MKPGWTVRIIVLASRRRLRDQDHAATYGTQIVDWRKPSNSSRLVNIYSRERSMVDAVRLRGRVGTGVAYEALRRYLRRPGASTGELLHLARRLRTGGPMVDALEVLTD
jgi:hypothetical protein